MGSDTLKQINGLQTAKIFFTQEQVDDGNQAQRNFKLIAYTGSIVDLGYKKIILDLDGISMPEKQIPSLYEHCREKIVGFVTKVDRVGSNIEANGVVIVHHQDGSVNPYGLEVVNKADSGFMWQCSVGVYCDEVENIVAGKTITVNNRPVTGPLLLVKKWSLFEISLCVLGADGQTEAAILNAAKTNMEASMSESKNVQEAIDLEAAKKEIENLKLQLAKERINVIERQMNLSLPENLKASITLDNVSILEDFIDVLQENEITKQNELKANAFKMKESRPDLFSKQELNRKVHEVKSNGLQEAVLSCTQSTIIDAKNK